MELLERLHLLPLLLKRADPAARRRWSALALAAAVVVAAEGWNRAASRLLAACWRALAEWARRRAASIPLRWLLPPPRKPTAAPPRARLEDAVAEPGSPRAPPSSDGYASALSRAASGASLGEAPEDAPAAAPPPLPPPSREEAAAAAAMGRYDWSFLATTEIELEEDDLPGG
jgi:hypothetical protein